MGGRTPEERPHYLEALHRTGLMFLLAGFDPHVAGTPPLGLKLPTSDIDVLCHVPDPIEFSAVLWKHLKNAADFSFYQQVYGDRPVIASFTAHGWTFELFGQARPVRDQDGWRHFLVERRLLALGGTRFRTAIMRQRAHGLKTEPAFAAVLGLMGDPYLALLALESCSDKVLKGMLQAAGFADLPA